MYMRISHPKNTPPHPEDLLVMLSVCDGDVLSNVIQLVLFGATSTRRSYEARKGAFQSSGRDMQQRA